MLSRDERLREARRHEHCLHTGQPRDVHFHDGVAIAFLPSAKFGFMEPRGAGVVVVKMSDVDGVAKVLVAEAHVAVPLLCR